MDGLGVDGGPLLPEDGAEWLDRGFCLAEDAVEGCMDDELSDVMAAG